MDVGPPPQAAGLFFNQGCLMKKFLAETKGDFQLVDFSNRQALLQAHRPSVIEMSSFFQSQMGYDRIKLLGEVSAEATDEEFVKYWDECDTAELAVDSFLAAFSVEETSAKPAAKGKGKAK
jgi:hypothetical protein